MLTGRPEVDEAFISVAEARIIAPHSLACVGVGLTLQRDDSVFYSFFDSEQRAHAVAVFTGRREKSCSLCGATLLAELSANGDARAAAWLYLATWLHTCCAVESNARMPSWESLPPLELDEELARFVLPPELGFEFGEKGLAEAMRDSAGRVDAGVDVELAFLAGAVAAARGEHGRAGGPWASWPTAASAALFVAAANGLAPAHRMLACHLLPLGEYELDSLAVQSTAAAVDGLQVDFSWSEEGHYDLDEVYATAACARRGAAQASARLSRMVSKGHLYEWLGRGCGSYLVAASAETRGDHDHACGLYMRAAEAGFLLDPDAEALVHQRTLVSLLLATTSSAAPSALNRASKSSMFEPRVLRAVLELTHGPTQTWASRIQVMCEAGCVALDYSG